MHSWWSMTVKWPLLTCYSGIHCHVLSLNLCISLLTSLQTGAVCGDLHSDTSDLCLYSAVTLVTFSNVFCSAMSVILYSVTKITIIDDEVTLGIWCDDRECVAMKLLMISVVCIHLLTDYLAVEDKYSDMVILTFRRDDWYWWHLIILLCIVCSCDVPLMLFFILFFSTWWSTRIHCCLFCHWAGKLFIDMTAMMRADIDV